MIEILLQAENALALGLLDQADRLFWQVVEADPGSAIAIVGLGRVAHERGDERTALAFARKALEADPENAMARRLVDRLEEIIRARGDDVPRSVAVPSPPSSLPPSGSGPVRPEPAAATPSAAVRPEPAAAAPASSRASVPQPGSTASPPSSHPGQPRRRGIIGRLLGRS